jgi:hypothetical protein
MAQRMIIFDADSLLRLMTHYSDGQLPLDSELQALGVSNYLQQWLRLDVRSHEWTAADAQHPLHFRYEGRKVMNWRQGSGQDPTWQEGADAPKRG